MATNRPPIKMKVPVATLLANAREYRDQLVAEGQEALRRYEAELNEYRQLAHEKLLEAAAKAADLDAFEWGESYINGRYRTTSISVEVGPKPIKPDVVDQADIDRDIALLAATSDETLVLTTEDNFARYLRSN